MIIARALENQDESAGLVLGDLIINLLRTVGQAVLPVLPQLLQTMAGRMTTAKTASFTQVRSLLLIYCSIALSPQSLIIPFAFLITNQLDTVLSLLESTEIQGRTALNIVINTWCENAETFQGFWSTRITTLALSQLLMSERPSLQNLMVKGDIIVKPEAQNGEMLSFCSQRLGNASSFAELDVNGVVIMTRSRTKKSTSPFLLSDALVFSSRYSYVFIQPHSSLLPCRSLSRHSKYSYARSSPAVSRLPSLPLAESLWTLIRTTVYVLCWLQDSANHYSHITL